jgi:hypothetical protein
LASKKQQLMLNFINLSKGFDHQVPQKEKHKNALCISGYPSTLFYFLLLPAKFFPLLGRFQPGTGNNHAQLENYLRIPRHNGNHFRPGFGRQGSGGQ